MATKPIVREDGKIQVFTQYIVRNGKRIYRSDGKMWMFWGDPNYNRKASNDENHGGSYEQKD